MNVMPFGPGWGQAKRTAVSGPSPVSDLLYQSFYDTLPGWYTFTRSSSAWGFNSAGVLTQFANNVSRQVYDPVTLAAQGTLLEPSSSNQIVNPRMEGASAPSTFPTGSGGFATGGLTRSVVGIGYEDGIPYLDMRVSGTTTGTAIAAYQPVLPTVIAAATGQTWTFSTFLRVVGGALGAPNYVRVGINEMTSGGAFVTGGFISPTPITAALRTQQNIYTRTLSGGATVAFAEPTITIQYPISTVVDVTLRIGLPQMEQQDWASSPIMPPVGSPAVSTRATEFLSLPLPFAGFPGAAGWSVMMELIRAPSDVFGALIGLSASGDFNNCSYVSQAAGGLTSVIKKVAGVAVTSPSAGNMPANTATRFALTQDAADARLCLTGGTPQAATNAGYPAMTQLAIGAILAAGPANRRPLTLRRLQLWPLALSDAELQG